MDPVDNLCPKVKKLYLGDVCLGLKYKSSAIKKKHGTLSFNYEVEGHLPSWPTSKKCSLSGTEIIHMQYSAIGLIQWPCFFAISATKFTAPVPTARWYMMAFGQQDIVTCCGRIAWFACKTQFVYNLHNSYAIQSQKLVQPTLILH